MDILVLVKQIPKDMNVTICPQTKTLMREGMEAIVNPYDLLALEMAVQMKETVGGSVCVLSMGPKSANTALRDCLSVGAQRAVLVCDKLFSGSDTLATSYVLSCAVRHIEQQSQKKFDLILCGKHSMDSDTAQVGPQVAEWMGYAQATSIVEVVSQNTDTMLIKREREEAWDMMQIELPCVLSIGNTTVKPRYPTMKSKIESRKAEIEVLTSEELCGLDKTRVGLDGSPTKTAAVEGREKNPNACVLYGEVREGVQKIVCALRQNSLI